jgi:hypothetical protein
MGITLVGSSEDIGPLFMAVAVIAMLTSTQVLYLWARPGEP